MVSLRGGVFSTRGMIAGAELLPGQQHPYVHQWLQHRHGTASKYLH
jgi:hypothetical protein